MAAKHFKPVDEIMQNLIQPNISMWPLYISLHWKEKYVRNEDTTSRTVAALNFVSFPGEWSAADRNHDCSSIPILDLLI